MNYGKRYDYVKSIGLRPLDMTKPGITKLDIALFGELSRASYQGTYRAVYTPLDVDTGQVPTATPRWKKKMVDMGYGKVAVWTSPNVWLVMNQYFSQRVCHNKSPNAPGPRLPTPDVACETVYSAVPVLFVDYTAVLGYKYVGETQPPDRPLAQQFQDWKNGVMLSRIHLPNNSITEEELQKIERGMGIKIPRGWYWVAFEATLMTPPGALIYANSAVLEVTVEDACKKYLHGLITRCPKMSEVLAEAVSAVQRMVAPLGFVVDRDATYTYEGHQYRGPVIVHHEGDIYTVVVPVKRQVGSLAIPVALVYALILLAVAIMAYAVAIKFLEIKAIYASIDMKRTEAFQQYLNFTTAVCTQNPDSPLCQNLSKQVSAVAGNTKPSGGGGGGGSGGGIAETAEKIGMVAIAVITAYAIAKYVSNRPRR